MKKIYESLRIEICLYSDDVITMSIGSAYRNADDNVGSDLY